MNQKFVTITIAGLSSPNTRRVYKGALEKFLTWLGDREINKAAVNEYKACLIARGLAPQSVNLHLAAIKRMVNELADLDMIDELTAARIARVKKIPRRGAKVGRWLTLEEADKLINAPPIDTCLECLRETGLILRCDRKVGNPFQTKQGSRPS